MRRTPRDLEQLKKKLGTTGGTGDVTGPSTSTTEQMAVFDGTTGKVIKGSTASGIIKAAAGIVTTAVAGDADLILPSQTGNNGKYLKTDGTNASWDSPAGSGDVTGPAGATDDDVALFDGATGKAIKDSGKKIAAANGIASLDASSKVVQDPANATATPGASKIPIANAAGRLDYWIVSGSTTVKGLVELATDGETIAGVAVQGDDSRLALVGYLSASFVDVSGSFVSLSGTFNALSASFIDLSGAFVNLSGVLNDLSSSYVSLSGTFNGLSGSFVSLSGTFNGLSGSFVSLSGTFNSLSASFVDVSGAFSSQTIDDLVPSQTGKSGSFLYTNGTAVSWHEAGSLGPTIGQVAARAVGGL